MSNLQPLYDYWQSSDTVGDVFNKQAERNGYYWIKALRQTGNELIRVNDNRPETVSEYQVPFDGPYFVIPYFTFDLFTGLGIRSIDGEQQRHLTRGVNFYSSERTVANSTEYRYHDPLVVCEGPMDAEYISQLYDYVIALQTNKPTNLQRKLLNKITDKVLFVPDNDEAGEDAIGYAKNQLENVSIVKPPSTYKDTGELFKEQDDVVFQTKLKTTLECA
jgi:5S rRNA maturation endonuclease (ribonuclease M5)